MLVTEPMEFERQLRGSLGRSSQRIELDRHVSVTANRVDQLSRGGNIAKKGGIDLSRRRSFGRSTKWRSCTTQTFSKSEKLTPRLVDRLGIPPVGFVCLAYVSVVEDARDRVGAHTSKFNCAPRSLARRRGRATCTLDASRQPAEF